jgi:hypothetical protein
MQWMGLLVIHCGMIVKRMGVLAVSLRKMKALTVNMDMLQTMKMDSMILIGKGR